MGCMGGKKSARLVQGWREKRSGRDRGLVEAGEMLRKSEHWLLFQRNWVQFLAPSRQLTIIYNCHGIQCPLLAPTGTKDTVVCIVRPAGKALMHMK